MYPRLSIFISFFPSGGLADLSVGETGPDSYLIFQKVLGNICPPTRFVDNFCIPREFTSIAVGHPYTFVEINFLYPPIPLLREIL